MKLGEVKNERVNNMHVIQLARGEELLFLSIMVATVRKLRRVELDLCEIRLARSFAECRSVSS
jgi:hypothetical protein